jgi:hypothetical protein
MTLTDEVMLILGVAAFAWMGRSVLGFVLLVVLGAVAAQNVANDIARRRRRSWHQQRGGAED